MNGKKELSYNWGEEAFDRAKKINKNIFLWIHQRGSYWCDIMMRETLSSSATLQKLEEEYITIVVDAVERPDIARYFQRLHKEIEGSEVTYPLSVFMTYDIVPLYISGYIPANSENGISSFSEVMELMSKAIKIKKRELIDRGIESKSNIEKTVTKIEATHIDNRLYTIVKQHIIELADNTNGGFGDRPKFPRHTLLSLIIDTLYKDNDNSLTEILTKSLDAIVDGGLKDSDNGFHHYTTDSSWTKPHYGKSLANNAQMISLLVKAYKKTQNTKYLDQAIATEKFISSRLMSDKLYYTLYGSELDDDTKVASYNAIMVSALIELSTVEEEYLTKAKNGVDDMLRTFLKENKLYHSISADGTLGIEALLDDYAHFGSMLLKLYQRVGDEQYAILTSEILNSAIKRFFNGGLWQYNIGELSTVATTLDRDIPSEIATITILLKDAAKHINIEYEKFAKRTVELHSYTIMRQPISTPELTRAAMELL